jgi:hypothetical protein
MKKKLLVVGVILIVIAILCLSLSLWCIFLWPGAFPNNLALTNEENREIKNIVLDAIMDRYSMLRNDSQEKSDGRVLQYDVEKPAHRSLFFIIDPFFMNTIFQSNGKYYVVVRMAHPEEYEYEFEIERDTEGNFYLANIRLGI